MDPQPLEYRSPTGKPLRNWPALVWLIIGVALLSPYGVLRGGRVETLCEHSAPNGFRVTAHGRVLEFFHWRKEERLPPNTPYETWPNRPRSPWDALWPKWIHVSGRPMGAVPEFQPLYAVWREHWYILSLPWYLLSVPPLLLALRSWWRARRKAVLLDGQ